MFNSLQGHGNNLAKRSMKMDTPSSLEVASTEDVIKALFEFLVDPLLPLKSSAKEAPSVSQQQSIAKQVHAVVLLYNYYQRKRYPEQEFLDFESFCKLAVVLKPSLLHYMKFMHQSNYAASDEVENELSLTEKAIRDACKLCSTLDISHDVPSTEEWPISKVAVLLIDSTKENCAVLYDSLIRGVWSVIEKEIDIPKISSESTVVGNLVKKRKRINKKPLREEQDADEAGFQLLAFSAVKEATGVNQSDLVVLESHVVYSLSKEKTATRFYIVQSTRSINEDLKIPIKDVVESLQIPLVKKISGSWTATAAVEYFHVLPYGGFLSDWFFRETSSNSSEDVRMGPGTARITTSLGTENPCDTEVSKNKEVVSSSLNHMKERSEDAILSTTSQITENNCEQVTKNGDLLDKNCCDAESTGNAPNMSNSFQKIKNSCDNEVYDSKDKSVKNCSFTDSSCKEASGASAESPKQKDNNGCQIFSPSNSTSAPIGMDIDEASAVLPHKKDEKNTRMAGKVYHHQRRRTSSTESSAIALTCGAKTLGAESMEKSNITKHEGQKGVDYMEKSNITKHKGEKVDTVNKSCSAISFDQDKMTLEDCKLAPFQPNANCLEKVQSILAAKENALTQTALKVLRRKRDRLSNQLRDLGDEIAICDKNIQTILDGGEDYLALTIETIIDCCNEFIQGKNQSQDKTYQVVEDPGLSQHVKSERLSEAIFGLRTPCQELDDICSENKWTLPTYQVSSSDGGFLAHIALKGMEFDFSCSGDLGSSPGEARDSAAAQMIVKLKNMAGQSQTK